MIVFGILLLLERMWEDVILINYLLILKRWFMFLVNVVVGWLINLFSVLLLLNRLFFDVLMLEFVSIFVSLLGRLMFFSVVVKLVLFRF